MSAAAFSAAVLGGKENAALTAAGFFVVAELVFDAWKHLPLTPFALCAGGFMALILVAAARPKALAILGGGESEARRSRAARFFALLLMTKFISVVTAVTGGTASPFAALLFAPVFIGALYFGVVGSAATSLAIVILFAILASWEPTSVTARRSDFLQGMVFLWVSVFAGLVVRRLEQVAQSAQARAKYQTDRATRLEWLNDTALMMESMVELEPMLGAGLLRVDELVPADTVAVFLREPDGPDFLLAQTLGIADASVGLHRIPLVEQGGIHETDHEALLSWSNGKSGAKGLHQAGVFAQMDSAARHVIVIPLRTFGDVFGLLYVARHGDKPFTVGEREDLLQMSRHIVYPIQRVRLQAMATTDALTGLSNQRAFRRRLQTEVERATRYRHSLSLLIVDIDHFKRANDTFGHRAGDALLAQMGGILSHACRGIDMAARYGGEELAIICPETVESEALRVAERVRAAVEEYLFALPDGRQTRLTISAGVATLPRDAVDAPRLIEAADRGLYAAKQSGRNRVCLAREGRQASDGSLLSTLLPR